MMMPALSPPLNRIDWDSVPLAIYVRSHQTVTRIEANPNRYGEQGRLFHTSPSRVNSTRPWASRVCLSSNT